MPLYYLRSLYISYSINNHVYLIILSISIVATPYQRQDEVPLSRNPTTMMQLLADLKHQVKQLQTNHDDHDDQLASIHTTISIIQKEVKKFESQIQDVTHKVEHVLANNQCLQDQVSRIEQHLLHSSKMCQWVVSQDQIKIGEEIGRGSWATVHKATFQGRLVAAKRLHEVICSPQTRELFQREMETAVICQHENIIKCFGVTLDGRPVILMELMDMSLRVAYGQNRITDNQKPQILCNVAQALHYLHSLPVGPVIHRDVSSANVLLKSIPDGKWLAKLGDLGTAKIQKHAATPGPGAIAYAAPEVAKPNCHSPKMDVYSFGILVLEVLTVTHPYQKINDLKRRVKQQFPRYYELVFRCTKEQLDDRPTMYEALLIIQNII